MHACMVSLTERTDICNVTLEWPLSQPSEALALWLTLVRCLEIFLRRAAQIPTIGNIVYCPSLIADVVGWRRGFAMTSGDGRQKKTCQAWKGCLGVCMFVSEANVFWNEVVVRIVCRVPLQR